MTNVQKLPVKFKQPRILPRDAPFNQPEAADEMVWALCDYVNRRMLDGRHCDRCPKWRNDPDHGLLMDGCYAMAEEASRVAMAALKLFPPPTPEISYRDAVIQYQEPPLALTDQHVSALEKAIRAEGFDIFADPETGDIKLERVKE